ncbi:thioredoxin fold domain-containing protein [Thiomicrospira microaerophila]|uniref:thioredoxin family protein n=1 Tax=Thiomicrospira microaerophila TaxID=406020 RepID=UPI00200EFB2A|nr:thioredoxin fold domain-containing protein [Thiomicrospira microaerophila]UQB42307.1 thioredoxin fold domain-containing protein [Thiomicrospira microaerophila]
MKKLLIFGFSLFLLAGCFDRQAHANMQELSDFHWLSQQARANNIPIMLMFTGPHCEFCTQLERTVFNPMLRGGMYEGYALHMRKVSELHQEIRFNADERITKRNLARMYRADVTPTVIFVDSRGIPVAEPMIGSMEVQLYLGMIHQRLNQAYERMGNPMRLPVNPDQMQRPLPSAH